MSAIQDIWKRIMSFYLCKCFKFLPANFVYLREYERLLVPYLKDWWQKSYSNCLVKYRGKTWFVKSKIGSGVTFAKKEKERDFLAYLLGRKLCNIAEVKPIDNGQFTRLCKSGIELETGASSENTFLVRFGHNHNYRHLPCKTLEDAFAAELVFSLWIRRRDAHSYNRCYVDGIPIFFDHQTAFLGEAHLADIGKFFKTGGDAGYAGMWRFEVGNHTGLDTLSSRHKETLLFQSNREDKHTSIPITDKAAFIKAAQYSLQKIMAFSEAFLEKNIAKAGFKGAEANEILEFLKENQNSLPEHLELLLKLLQARPSNH